MVPYATTYNSLAMYSCSGGISASNCIDCSYQNMEMPDMYYSNDYDVGEFETNVFWNIDKNGLWQSYKDIINVPNIKEDVVYADINGENYDITLTGPKKFTDNTF